MERWDQGNVILVSSQDTATALQCPGGTVSSRVVALVCCTRTQITMQIPSPGPAAAGRLHPPLHLGVMKAGGLLGMSSERWTESELVATRPLEIIINLNRFCDQDTKCLGIAIRIIAWDLADFYADMFRLNQPNIFRAEVVTFGWLGVAGAGEVPATIRAEVRCWYSENINK